MTTTRFQQSDYKSNVDQTDGHLHVSSGSKSIKVEEQNSYEYEIRLLLSELITQQKKTNMYLSIMTDTEITDSEVV